jgi:hypothetical protein
MFGRIRKWLSDWSELRTLRTIVAEQNVLQTKLLEEQKELVDRSHRLLDELFLTQQNLTFTTDRLKTSEALCNTYRAHLIEAMGAMKSVIRCKNTCTLCRGVLNQVVSYSTVLTLEKVGAQDENRSCG